MFRVGDRVEHPTFGEGTIESLEYDFASVLFDSVGTKNVTLSFLSLSKKIVGRKSGEAKQTKQVISDVELLAFLIYIFEDKNATYMTFSDVKDEVFKEYGYSAFSLEDIKRIVEPHSGIVFYNNLVIKHNKINKSGNKIYRKNKSLGPDEFFISKCSLIRNENLLYADILISRFLIKTISELEAAPHTRIIIEIKKLIRFVVNSLLFIKTFTYRTQKFTIEGIAPFLEFDLEQIISYLSNADANPVEYSDFLKQFSAYVTKYKICDFYICDSFYEYQEENNIIVIGLPLTKEIFYNYKDYELRCIDSMVALAVCSKEDKAMFRTALKKKEDERLFTHTFDYDDEFISLKDEIEFDICLNNHFKELMRKHGIPANKKSFDYCLKKLCLKSKNGVIFPNKYKDIGDYFTKKIMLEEIHHYSNPMAIDEYDKVLKKLEKRLDIIEFEKGLFITKAKLEKSGINNDTIDAFRKKILRLGRSYEYFSFKHIYLNLQGDPVVEFCYTDELLFKFVSSIKDISVIDTDENGFIFTLDDSGKAKGNFLKYILDDSDSMTVREIEDYVGAIFGVKYTMNQIKKAISGTDLYFSEEMETVYRDKKIFLDEVFEYGN